MCTAIFYIFQSRRTNCIESDDSWVAVLRPDKIENFIIPYMKPYNY